MSEHDKGTLRATADERFASHRSFRASLVQLLRRQLFGPSIGDGDGDLVELLTVSPLQLYATGVLFPQRLVQNLLEGGRSQRAAMRPTRLKVTLHRSRSRRARELRAEVRTAGRVPKSANRLISRTSSAHRLVESRCD
jgi:hypothetical protein